MSRRQTYQHLISTDVFKTRTKVKEFKKPRVTKARKDNKVRG
mgnify:FL=1